MTEMGLYAFQLAEYVEGFTIGLIVTFAISLAVFVTKKIRNGRG